MQAIVKPYPERSGPSDAAPRSLLPIRKRPPRPRDARKVPPVARPSMSRRVRWSIALAEVYYGESAFCDDAFSTLRARNLACYLLRRGIGMRYRQIGDLFCLSPYAVSRAAQLVEERYAPADPALMPYVALALHFLKTEAKHKSLTTPCQ